MTLGTNAGSSTLPFQGWCKIKEAFTPELIERAIRASHIEVKRCIDPFGGSGTTGLACQFLGVHPLLGEVSPYLADVIEAKLTLYPESDSLSCDLDAVLTASRGEVEVNCGQDTASLPATFVEPGVKDRWIFDGQVAERILALRTAIESLDGVSRRLFRVLLGGILLEVSNVRVSGKGRRYRDGWENRTVPAERVTELFADSARRAIQDIQRFRNRPVTTYKVIRGDSRTELEEVEECELAVFSPPYPNSSDYTDVYNVELWLLGYLQDSEANIRLRSDTISSHVQVSREFSPAPEGSPKLSEVLEQLDDVRTELWNPRIPEMAGAYFSDLIDVLDHLHRILVSQGSAWMVVGDSRYKDVQIPVATVLAELASYRGWQVQENENLRTMRTSAQQGGSKMLPEQLLILTKST